MEKTEKSKETFYLKMIKKEKKGGKVNVFKRILTTTTQSLVIVPSQGTLVVMEVLVLLIMMVLTLTSRSNCKVITILISTTIKSSQSDHLAARPLHALPQVSLSSLGIKPCFQFNL